MNRVIFTFDERPSDSPLVETVWRTQSVDADAFTSIAEIHYGMVVTTHQGKMTLTVRGPETKATLAPIPENAEFIGIIFKLGTFMPHLPTRMIMDRAGLNLPEAASDSFWLNGSAWQFPDYDNADTFVDRLVRDGLLTREPVVEAALQGHLRDLSLRSVQRRFLQATGLTQRTVYQIKRAQQAMTLLEGGKSILDTVEQAGYADQPHLTRSLKHYMGQTPAQIVQVPPLVPHQEYKSKNSAPQPPTPLRGEGE